MDRVRLIADESAPRTHQSCFIACYGGQPTHISVRQQTQKAAHQLAQAADDAEHQMLPQANKTACKQITLRRNHIRNIHTRNEYTLWF